MEIAADVPARLTYTDFEGFYRAQWDLVYRPLVVTIRDPHLAREAVDEAMARAFQHWPQVCGYRNQAGWVYRVAYNWAVSNLRKRRRDEDRHAALVTDRVWEPIGGSDIDLSAALLGLPLSQRAVVVLRFLMDWSEREVADALGVSLGTVKSRLHRALRRLRKELT
jgi:RNA polymerase sigma-70 factor (ECF subfamily)